MALMEPYVELRRTLAEPLVCSLNHVRKVVEAADQESEVDIDTGASTMMTGLLRTSPSNWSTSRMPAYPSLQLATASPSSAWHTTSPSRLSSRGSGGRPCLVDHNRELTLGAPFLCEANISTIACDVCFPRGMMGNSSHHSHLYGE